MLPRPAARRGAQADGRGRPETGLPALSKGHLLGTDADGDDVLARLLCGGRSSLIVAFCMSVIGLTVGGTLGAVSGYIGGIVDTIVMRVLDVLIAFPSLLAASRASGCVPLPARGAAGS